MCAREPVRPDERQSYLYDAAVGDGTPAVHLPSTPFPEIKKTCRSVTQAQCEAVARHALTLENARDVKSYLRSELKKCVPDLLT